jgi:hypothetical protein
MKHLLIFLFFLYVGNVALCQDKVATKKEKPENSIYITQKAPPKKAQSILHLPVVYTFIGNGNWSDPANWDANGVPPDETNPDSKIYINNIPGGRCYLDVPYIVKSGTLPTWLIVFTGSNLVIPEKLTVK